MARTPRRGYLEPVPRDWKAARGRAETGALLAAAPLLRPLVAQQNHAHRFGAIGRFLPGSFLQKPEELIGLARLAAECEPRTVCEIGTYNGGTSLFLCGLPSVARFVGMDIKPLNRREIGVILLPNRGPHRMHEHTVTIGDSCDDTAGDVVLHGKDRRSLKIPVVGLRPKLRSSLGVDELGAHSNDRIALANASFQCVARTEFGPQGAIVFSLPLPANRRGGSNDRQIPKPRKPGRDLLDEAIGKRIYLRVTEALERKHGDP